MPGRTFTGPADFNTQLQQWLAQVNERVRRVLGCAPTDRIGADRQAMLALPPVAPAVGWRSSTRLARDHYVRLDSNDYSVHAGAIGRRIEVVAALGRVRVLTDGRVVAGTGLQCYGFKGGTGTASRQVALGEATYTVGVLVQANHGDRRHFEVNGVPVGQVLGWREVPVPRMSEITRFPPGTGSVIAVVATDAPLLPHQLNRLAQRAGLGIAKFGARGDNYSGDLMIAFSTAARGLPDQGPGARTPVALSVQTLALPFFDAMFAAVIEATAEAILNAMLQAESMMGRDGLVLRALEGHRLAEILDGYDRRRFSAR